MSHLARYDELLFKAVERFIGLGKFQPDHFHRDYPVQFAVTDFVDRTHSTFAELFQDFVAVSEDTSYSKHSMRNACLTDTGCRREIAARGHSVGHGLVCCSRERATRRGRSNPGLRNRQRSLTLRANNYLGRAG